MEDLIKKIEQWAHERNLINGCQPIDQAMKLFSEYGIGDVFVVLVVMCKQRNETVPSFTEIFHTNTFSLKKNVVGLSTYINSVADDDVNSEYSQKMLVNQLCVIAEHKGLTLKECVEHAYNEIKDRKGIMYNGTFIKEDDERYTEVTKQLEVSQFVEIDGYKLFENPDEAIYVAKSKEAVLKYHKDTYGTPQDICNMTDAEFLESLDELAMNSDQVKKQFVLNEEGNKGNSKVKTTIYQQYLNAVAKKQDCMPIFWFYS